MGNIYCNCIEEEPGKEEVTRFMGLNAILGEASFRKMNLIAAMKGYITRRKIIPARKKP